MPFWKKMFNKRLWKKMFNKRQGVYYPRAVVQGKPVETPAPNSF